MNKEITLQNELVIYTLKKSSRARRMRLAVQLGGEVVVTAPKNIRERIVENFIKEKADWVLNKIKYFSQFNNNAKIPRFSKSHYLKNKDDVRKLINKRAVYFSNIHGFKYNRISVRNQKTRWGSCSKKGNLNFNYKIFFLPEKTRDYIIVHELCHLKEFNHSQKFWSLVGEIIPDYYKIRKELKKQGLFFQ